MPALLDNGFNISTLTGVGGEGKSYVTVHDLAHNRLVRWRYPLFTNLPLKVDELAEYVARQRKCDPQEVAERIHKIPDDMLETWAAGEGGPWDLAEEFQQEPCDFILDESHVFCPVGNKVVEKKWQEFLGEARHHGLLRVQFITQSVKKVSPVIDQHASTRYLIEKGDRRRTRLLKVPMSDVYELLGSITGRYEPITYRTEQIKDVGGKWRRNHEDIFSFRPEVFDLYVSKSKPGGKSGEEEAAQHEKKEYEKRPRLLPSKVDYEGFGEQVVTLPTWAWVAGRNPMPVAKLLGTVCLLLFFFNGGLGFLIGKWLAYGKQAIASAVQVEGFEPNGGNHAASTAVSVQTDTFSTPDVGDDHRQLIVALATRIAEDHERRVLGARIVAIGPHFVRFASGNLVRLGERVNGGEHDGKIVETINFSDREVVFDTGDRWRMFNGAAEPYPTPAPVQELLQRAEAAVGPLGTSGSDSRHEDVAGNQRNAAG